MLAKKRFLLGGSGALMPVLVSLLAIDIGASLNDESALSPENIVGIGIRYIVLFVIGGFVAYLHDDENKAFKLFELGIVAPALITSVVTAQGLKPADPLNVESSQTQVIEFSLISTAYAAETPDDEDSSYSTFRAILDGATGRAYRKVKNSDSQSRRQDNNRESDDVGDTRRPTNSDD